VLSTRPNSQIPNWCYASKDDLANGLGIAKSSLMDIQNRMIEKGFVDRDPVTRFIRTTQLWNEVYFERDPTAIPETGTDASRPPYRKPVQPIPETGTEAIPETGTYSNNNTITKNSKGRRTPSEFVAPTSEEVEAYFDESGYTRAAGAKAWKYYDSAKWKDRDQKQVHNWKQKMIAVWFKPENAKPADDGSGEVTINKTMKNHGTGVIQFEQ
jgi:hypothetical protein